jgi:hypothetical protein
VSRRDLLRIAAGIAAGLGIAMLPFLQYGVRSHDHTTDTAREHARHEHHHHHHHEGDEP